METFSDNPDTIKSPVPVLSREAWEQMNAVRRATEVMLRSKGRIPAAHDGYGHYLPDNGLFKPMAPREVES